MNKCPKDPTCEEWNPFDTGHCTYEIDCKVESGSQLSEHCQKCEHVDKCNKKRLEAYNYIVPTLESGTATFHNAEKMWIESDSQLELIMMPEGHTIKELGNVDLNSIVNNIKIELNKCYFDKSK